MHSDRDVVVSGESPDLIVGLFGFILVQDHMVTTLSKGAENRMHPVYRGNGKRACEATSSFGR